MAVNLGDKVRDTISALEGIVVLKSYHLNGCVQVMIETPVRSDGKNITDLVDVARVVVIEPGAYKAQEHEEAAGPGGASNSYNIPKSPIR